MSVGETETNNANATNTTVTQHRHKTNKHHKRKKHKKQRRESSSNKHHRQYDDLDDDDNSSGGGKTGEAGPALEEEKALTPGDLHFPKPAKILKLDPETDLMVGFYICDLMLRFFLSNTSR